MDDRKCFGELSDHSTDCVVGWRRVPVGHVKDSAERGCNRCAIHFEAIQKCAPTWVHDATYASILRNSRSPSVRIEHGETRWWIQFFTNDDLSQKLLPNIPFRPNGARVPSDDFSLSRKLEKAMQWLRLCVSEHTTCGSEAPKPLPTRILDINASPIRLVLGAGRTKRYACLSHCWGEKPVLETTLESISKLQHSVPWDDLPATFKDAVTFARGLGLNYLWIDSLCIIQNDTSDPSDWPKESAQMASIYENAYVTIAAATSANSTVSCFEGKPPSVHNLYKPHKLQSIQKLGAGSCSVSARWSFPHAVDGIERVFFPLLSRAWVFQERILSPRVIYLGVYELQWECRWSNNCECGAVSDNGAAGTNSRNLKATFAEGTGALNRKNMPLDSVKHKTDCGYCRSGRSHFTRLDAQAQRINRLYTESYVVGSEGFVLPPYPEHVAWRELLNRYTSLKLTYTNDIFPALSGLAHAWHNQHGSRYLAGLWERHFIHDLLWYKFVPHHRPDDWRAPTWSWASLQGGMNLHSSIFLTYHEMQLVAERTRVEAAECALDGPDWAGRLRSAQLSITCKAIAGTIHHWLSLQEMPRYFTQRDRLPFRLITHDVVYQHEAIFLDSFIQDRESPAFLKSGSAIYLLPLAVTAFNSSPTSTESEDMAPIDDCPVQCLVVSHKEGSGDASTYERIGYAVLHPSLVHRETLVVAENRKPNDDPKEWPQIVPPTEVKRQEELGLKFNPWRYDAHCKVTKMMREAPTKTFTIV
ncbi:HET-domain-containing protein [Lentithecium fluviatile CBS 122367]|uniref:HET-domain-containing protein n=1 Tax=Lentithecium fluviatile CBS 122367 TaxID=1168545 RepID=A0A6G1JDZ3_9PLEO|nr:HET-domain-containing protein [Lentithecium fluviatile CBS 122367]